MLFGKALAVFVEGSAVSGMVRAAVQRVLDPAVLDQIFVDHALLGYPKALTFSQFPNAFRSCAASCSRKRLRWGRSIKTDTRFP